VCAQLQHASASLHVPLEVPGVDGARDVLTRDMGFVLVRMPTVLL
jgi:hypothetical protein